MTPKLQDLATIGLYTVIFVGKKKVSKLTLFESSEDPLHPADPNRQVYSGTRPRI